MKDMKDHKIMPYMWQTASFSTLARASRSMAACEGRSFSSTSFSSLERLQRNIKHTCMDLSLMSPRCVRQCHIQTAKQLKLICESVVVVAAGRGGGGGGGGGNAVFSGSFHISQAMQHILQRKAHWI